MHSRLARLSVLLLYPNFLRTNNVQPTWGAISREGLAQYSMTCDTLGLYARSAQDLELLSAVFQLTDDEPLPRTPFLIKGSKVAFLKTHVWPKAGPGTQAAWEKAKELLGKEGASVEEIELPEEFAKISDWHAAVLAGEGRTSFLGSMKSSPKRSYSRYSLI
jgi:Asp-tRNA(Asn)/Glu-tRNA(Gln) amidotransferase A subunit family amidase